MHPYPGNTPSYRGIREGGIPPPPVHSIVRKYLSKMGIMENHETINSNAKPDSITYDELFSGLSSTGIYSHLQILLHREHTITKPEFGRKFLMVSPNTFGLVRLNDLYLCDDLICLELDDVFTGLRKPVFIPVNDKCFRFVLIA